MLQKGIGERQMKALILNSGIGRRMGALTSNQPKCMTKISEEETILSRQLRQLHEIGVTNIIITTGLFDKEIQDHCLELELPIHYTFVKNPIFDKTNYIYSIYLARDYVQEDLLLLHGDLIFEDFVLDQIYQSDYSCMAVSGATELPDKDFKAVVHNNRIYKVGIEFFDNAVAAQPLYFLKQNDWMLWLDRIINYCENGTVSCYAENALNEITDSCILHPMDVGNLLCNEIDTPNDLIIITNRLKEIEMKSVYMSFSTDIIHSGHINIIRKASKLGKLTIGVLSDEAVASYKRFPLIPYSERKELIQNIIGVHQVVLQDTLSYKNNLLKYKPDYVVHGDDWKTGFQTAIRDEVIDTLLEWGGQLIEYPYSRSEIYKTLEQHYREQLSIPDFRRGRLRKLLGMKKTISIIEAHSGITGLIAERTTVLSDGKAYQFDGMWVSSLCDSTVKGKPDIELVDMSSRLRTIDDIMEVTTKPIILDGDTGGQIEHFIYNVHTLERIGVSAIIIEDKTGLKRNSLFGTEVEQTQDTIENFCSKIAAGIRTRKTKEFMIIARIESLILERGMDDALTRAFAYVKAGADGIMIHSRKKDPDEIFEFCEKFRAVDKATYIVVVPTSFNEVTEEEFEKRGVNIVIYANHLTRSSIPSMQRTAECILTNHRGKEADEMCMSIKDILRLIPEE
jgi:phosphoenolpyruvate phosphomutase